jgi:hypothetical protein
MLWGYFFGYSIPSHPHLDVRERIEGEYWRVADANGGFCLPVTLS